MCRCIEDAHPVRARKPHYCDWCGKRIEVGETYMASTYVYDVIYTWHECERCKEYVSEMLTTSNGDVRSGEDFDYYMHEEHRDVWNDWHGGGSK